MLPRYGLYFKWSSWLRDQRHSVSRRPFSCAYETHPLVRRRFDGDLCRGHVQDSRDVGPHLIDIWGNFRALQNDRSVDIDNRDPVLREEVAYVLEEKETRYPFEAWVSVGEMLPDVPEAGSAEQCIAEGMQENVCIGMAVQPLLVRDIDPTQDEFSPGGKPMNIVAKTDACRWLNRITVSESAGPGGSAPSIQSGGLLRVPNAVPP